MYRDFRVTFRDRKGKVSTMDLRDTNADVRDTASFFVPSRGAIVKVEVVR
jgi:hypothetical protein